MTKPKVLILRAPGTNCDLETAYAFERAGAEPERLHVNRLLECPRRFEQFQILCVPGGFTYGDDIAAGRILGNQVLHHLADALARFRDEGKLILGICNGFQVLMRAGLLLDGGPNGPPATLTWNDSGKFEARWVLVGVSGSGSVFLQGIETLYLPVAHAEGKFVTRSAETLRQLEAEGRLVLRYRSQQAAAGEAAYPDNPNGSMAAVAGVRDATGRVLGLMPHPERYIDPTHHPRWTRGEAAATTGDGLRLFKAAVDYFM